jgi:hypothetical protein
MIDLFNFYCEAIVFRYKPHYIRMGMRWVRWSTEQKRWRSHDDPTQFSQDFTNVALNCICYPQFKILVYNWIIIRAYPSSYTRFNGNRSFPNRWRDTLDAAATHVANRKDSQQTGFEQVRRTDKGPACILLWYLKEWKAKTICLQIVQLKV